MTGLWVDLSYKSLIEKEGLLSFFPMEFTCHSPGKIKPLYREIPILVTRLLNNESLGELRGNPRSANLALPGRPLGLWITPATFEWGPASRRSEINPLSSLTTKDRGFTRKGLDTRLINWPSQNGSFQPGWGARGPDWSFKPQAVLECKVTLNLPPKHPRRLKSRAGLGMKWARQLSMPWQQI